MSAMARNAMARNNLHVRGKGSRALVVAYGFGCDGNMGGGSVEPLKMASLVEQPLNRRATPRYAGFKTVGIACLCCKVGWLGRVC